ncbi:MAG TPA: hypothetical protein PLB52_02170 [Candidatus Moranbacteria bacterium]|nr:hypothetical protein [Candidatus Moranbacteria bacterium]
MKMKKITDPELENQLSKITLSLAGASLFSKIKVILTDNIGCLGYFGFNFQSAEGIIMVNVKAKKMLNDKEERSIVFATLSHEIGHIKHCLENVAFYLKLKKGGDSFLEINDEVELSADREALPLLKKFYENPKEILLKQIEFAVQTVMQCEYATEEDKKATVALARKRREALNFS